MSETRILDTVEVRTGAGTVRGAWRPIPGADGSRSAAFLGIPFAQPPTGRRRFAAPVPVEPWEGVRGALEYGATAQRWVPPEPTLIPEPSVPGKSTLNVNVFTPRPDSDAKLPVLVWIHGGGYVSGSPASPWYDGIAFNRDGIVTVSISYRLGFDGFGWIEGAPANRGVLDWIAALEWVRDEISAFGGDPSDVTIAGQSAGGGAVLTLLGLPEAQELFHRAISISGAVADIPVARAREAAGRLAAMLEVEPDRDGFASVPEKQIERRQVAATRDPDARGLGALRAALDATVPYGPVVDGELLTRPTLESIAAGVGADKALVIGATDDEFSMITDAYRGKLRFVPSWVAMGLLGIPRRTRRGYLADNRAVHGTASVTGRYVTDHVFRRLVAAVADARRTSATWVYRFSWRSPTRGIALHCLDVPFFFDCLQAERVDALAGDDPPQPLADAVHGAAVSFLRGGDPGWRAWSDARGTTRVFGAPPGAREVDPDGYASVRALL